MTEAWAFLIFFLLIILLFASLPIIIAVIAYQSRKSKRNRIIQTLPQQTDYIAAVRLNTPKQNDRFVKMKAFEFSGVLYVSDTKIHVRGTKSQYFEFDLQQVAITWPGIQVQNGALQWFCLDDMQGQKLYVNGESGVFVFRLSSKLHSTKDIYTHLLNLQNTARIGK